MKVKNKRVVMNGLNYIDYKLKISNFNVLIKCINKKCKNYNNKLFKLKIKILFYNNNLKIKIY